MSENISDSECRRRLEAAKFFYEQVKLNFQDRTKFRYLLDAFLASARSVTHAFKAEFDKNEPVMSWYQNKVEEWENNKVMKFFKKMRNNSLKEHTPNTRTTVEVAFSIDAILVDQVIGEKNSPNGTTEKRETSPHVLTEKNKKEKQTTPTSSKVVSYSFLHPFKWFDENPDVMNLCKRYLDELEKFVTEAENMIKKRK